MTKSLVEKNEKRILNKMSLMIKGTYDLCLINPPSPKRKIMEYSILKYELDALNQLCSCVLVTIYQQRGQCK